MLVYDHLQIELILELIGSNNLQQKEVGKNSLQHKVLKSF